MADTVITNTTASKTDSVNIKIGQGTAVDAANTHVITPTGPLDRLLIIFHNSEGTTNVLTVKAGDNPPAASAGMGDLVLTATAATSGQVILPPLESARFLHDDGKVRITLEAGTTGFIQAIQLPQV